MTVYRTFSHGVGQCPGQVAVPLVYDESLSIEQQIAVLAGQIQSLTSDYVTKDELADDLAGILGRLESATRDLMKYTDREVSTLGATLRGLIGAIEAGAMAWDVTEGIYNEATRAARNAFDDVTVHGVSVETLSECGLDVDGIAECGLNVRGLAVWAGPVLVDGFEPEGVFFSEEV